MQGNHMDSAAAIRTAADTLVASNPLWSHGRFLLQTDSYAALLYNGTMLSLWHGQVSCPRDPIFVPTLHSFMTPATLTFCNLARHKIYAILGCCLLFFTHILHGVEAFLHCRSWRSACQTCPVLHPLLLKYQGTSTCVYQHRHRLCWEMGPCACWCAAREALSQTRSCSARHPNPVASAGR